MAPSKSEKYTLLRNQEPSYSDERDSRDDVHQDMIADDKFGEPTYQKCQKGWWITALITSFVGSAVANVLLVIALVTVISRLPSQQSSPEALTVSSAYAGLSDDPAVHFPHSIGYGPEITNHSLADERWEAIDINAGIVALPVEWAAEHNLPPSQPFPWDASKSVYTLTAFHTLHCLKNIHRIIYDAHHGRPLSRDVGHAMHCVDHIRKDAMCNADDFLLPTPPEHYGMAGPRGQSRVCRNWDQLLDWAGEHHACYQHLDDDEEAFAKEHKEIERYRNCPPGSPYEAKMKAYFAES